MFAVIHKFEAKGAADLLQAVADGCTPRLYELRLLSALIVRV